MASIGPVGPRCQGLCRKVASLRSGGRRLAVRTAMEHPIGTLPRTPFPASRDFPSRGNERYEGKNSESYTSRTISAFSLFGGCRHHLALWEACHMIQKSKSRNADFILIAREGDTTTLGAKGPVKPKNPWAEGPSILRTFPSDSGAAQRPLFNAFSVRSCGNCGNIMMYLQALTYAFISQGAGSASLGIRGRSVELV